MNNISASGKSIQLSKDIGILLIRVLFGASMLFGHGLDKWGRLFGANAIHFSDPFGIGPSASLGLAVLAEVIASSFVMIGLLTRVALVPLITTMAVALFIIHANDNFAAQEKAILYGVVFLGLMFTGPGRFSIDFLLK